MSTLEQLLNEPVARRNEAWEKSVLAELPKAQARVLTPDPQQGPDGWPYLLVETIDATAGDAAQAGGEPLVPILNWLSTRGIGLVINPQKTAPDYVFTYGMVWNFRERGEFLTPASLSKAAASGTIDLANGQSLLTGPPSDAYLPSYAKTIIKQFLFDQGILAPKVLMVSFDGKEYDLCFSIESLKSPPQSEHAGIAEAIAWFLPAHYTVALVSEKSIPGFQPL